MRALFAPPRNRRGMTFMEILLVLALAGVVLSMVWQLISLYSRHYLLGERRLSQAQLVRSISQLLSDDLGSAIQDPIHPDLDERSGAVAVRRFGLRGERDFLAIDVVEVNPLTRAVSPEENRRYAQTGGKPKGAQVPELKTVFYEFVPISARQDEKRTHTQDLPDGGSQVIGTLTTDNGISGTNMNTPLLSGPLVRQFGLARRELDFETPEGDPIVETTQNNSSPFGEGGSGVVGSLSAPPTGAFASSGVEENFTNPTLENSVLIDSLQSQQTNDEKKESLTASQIALSMENGTSWAPEVVDCSFRYFDGKNWYTRWNSIENAGLPAAIEVTLRMMNLDDVETLRASEYRPMIQTFGGANPPTQNRGSTVIGTLGNQLSSNGGYSTNTGSPSGRLTLDQAVDLLGLNPIITRSVMIYLPTTPLSSHSIAQRRRPTPVQSSAVDSIPRGGEGAREVQGTVPEPRTPDPVRELIEREAGTKTAQERIASERGGVGRTTGERVGEGRTASVRASQERGAISGIFEEDFPPENALPLTPSEDPFRSIDAAMTGFEPLAEGATGGWSAATGGAFIPLAPKTSAEPQKKGTQTWLRKGH